MPRKKSEELTNVNVLPNDSSVDRKSSLTAEERRFAEAILNERFKPIMDLLTSDGSVDASAIINQLYIDVVDAARQRERQAEIFNVLSDVDVSPFVQKMAGENGELKYLSWASAYKLIKQRYPFMTWRWLCFPDKEGSLHRYQYDKVTGNFTVYTEVTIEGMTLGEALTITDKGYRPVRVDSYKFFDKYVPRIDDTLVNHAIRRCFVKNLALFGLGLDLYTGEDIPDSIGDEEPAPLEKESSEPQAQEQTCKEAFAPETIPVVQPSLTEATQKPSENTVESSPVKQEPKVTEMTLEEAMNHRFENGITKLKGEKVGDIVLKYDTRERLNRFLNLFAASGVGSDKIASIRILKALEDGELNFPKAE